ncbi:MAG: fatty acid desaturase, partial [Gemmatimonadales bacterium]
MGASQERGIRAWRSVVYLIEVWGVIVAAVALVVWQPTWWAALIAAPIIAGRQHALLIVEHECWHFNLFETRRLNNIAGSLLSGWAVGSPYIKGRGRHLAHHRLLGSDDDPDLDYHRTVTSGKQARRHFLLHLFGGQIVYTLFLGQKGHAGANTGDKGSILPDLIGMAVTQTGILAA